MFQYVSLGLVAITALIVLINLLKGVLRGLKKTIGTLVAIVISAIVAAIVTFIICDPSSSVMTWLMDTVKGLLAQGELQDIFGIEALGEALTYYVSMILAPFAFLIIYIVLSIIVSIIVAIAVKFIPPHNKPAPIVHRLGGLGVGLVCGLLVAAIVLMPVVGVLNVAVEIGQSDVLELDPEDDMAKIIDEASKDQIFAVYSTCCSWMFDSMTSANFQGERVYLKNDIGVILAVVGNIQEISGEADDFGDEQVDALNKIVDSLDESPLLKYTLSGVLSEMAGKWVAGESFIGMEKIDAGELLNPVIDTILDIISTSNKDNIVADMRTLTDILSVFVKHDMLSSANDYQAMLNILGKDGVIKELIDVANSNERMTVLSDQITQLSIRALASTIGIPKDANDKYDHLMSEIAKTLNDSYGMSEEERFEYCRGHVSDSLDKYGVDAEGMAIDHITDSILCDLGSKSNVSGEDISEFFTIYAIASENSDVRASGSGFDLLADEERRIVINTDGTISVGGKVLKNYNARNYGESAAYTMGKEHADFGDAATLYSAQAMKSSLVTLEDILSHVTKYSDCTDPDAETRKIADILSSAMDIFGEGIDDMSKTDLLVNIGELLDKMSATEIFGDGVTSSILKAIIQSDTVKGELGLSNKEVNAFADKLNATAKSENGSYAGTTAMVSHTITVVDKISDENATKEELRQSTEKLMSDMTPENAELLSTMTTPSMMEKYGVESEKSGLVSNSVSKLFSNMANFQSSTSSSAGDEEYGREADAVNTVLKLAMDGSDSDAKSLFATDGESGRIDATPDEYVELLVGSEVVSETLLTTVYDDGNTDNPFGVYPTDGDKEVLSVALTDYYNNNSEGLSEEEHDLLVRKLNAVAIVSNIETPFAE